MIASLLLAPLVLSAAAAPQPQGAPSGGTTSDGQDVPIIQDAGDTYILSVSEDRADQMTLEAFVNVCEEATGLNFTYNDQTGNALRTAKLFMHGTKDVPKADFYRFFQIMMFINDFVCVEVGPPRISVILIQSLAAGGATSGRTIKQKAEYVLPENLQNYADQPATLITTVLHLPNTEVRSLSTSLRTLLTDTTTQSLIAAGDHSVILQGFGSNMASLANLLLLIDRESAVLDDIQPVFDVIPLEFASGENVADLIDQLMEASRSARRATPGGDGARGPSGAALAGQDAEVKILVDDRTNSLLVMALPDDMPRIKDLVARLDVDVVEPDRNYHVYSLQNVAAEELADVLDEFLQDAGRVTQNEGGTGGRAQGQGTGSSRQNDVVVVPDEATNSLLIAAGKTRFQEVKELIFQLDRRQDQVLIETALIELTGRDFRDIGVELAGADVMNDGGFGVTNFGLSTITDSDGDGVPDLRVPNTSNGVTAGILDGDAVNLPVLLAALDQLDQSNVLNVPSVLVNNNRTATVRTLDEQPTTVITATGGVGGQTQESFNGYEEAGITLVITPSISAARYLRLDVSLLVSTFAGAFQGAIPPPRITRELITTVNVPDGDTMVVGGIITDNMSHTRRGVPWLGDLPLVGMAFRRDTDSNDRTTLYFFVTPHILRDNDFADLAEISYRKKLEAAEVIGSDRVRVIDPAFSTEDSEIDWEEQFGVPLYRSPERGEVDFESVGIDPVRRAELLEQANGGPYGARSGDDDAAEETVPAEDTAEQDTGESGQ